MADDLASIDGAEVVTEPKCVRCGGTDDLMDRGMAPGMTYCAPCRTSPRTSLREQYEAATKRNARLPDSMSLAPKTAAGRKASGHAQPT